MIALGFVRVLMSLWVDKYRPRSLDKLLFHVSITENLRALSSVGDFPHLLVYGPSGSGKKTRVYATLHELFGSQVEKLKINIKTFTTNSNRKLEFNVLSSPFHLEITPSDMGNNDRVVIQDLLKDVASTEQVDFTNLGGNGAKARHRFKVVIINEAESLTRDAQAALRRTMEKYSANIRLIMICNTTSNIIPPIKSRTLLIRIPAPSPLDIAEILLTIAQKENVDFNGTEDQRNQFFRDLAFNCDQNLRKCLLCFETILMQNAVIQPSSTKIDLDWETLVNSIASDMLKNPSVTTLSKIRVTFYELLAHCIPARIILKNLVFALLNARNDKVGELVEIAATFDERLSLGSKLIFHLEGFAANAMMALS